MERKVLFDVEDTEDLIQQQVRACLTANKLKIIRKIFLIVIT